MDLQSIKNKLYKATETKRFWSIVTYIFLLALILIFGDIIDIYILVAFVLGFSVTYLLNSITFLFKKNKPYKSWAITILITIICSSVLLYYKQIILIKFGYIFGLIFGIGFMLIYHAISLIYKTRS